MTISISIAHNSEWLSARCKSKSGQNRPFNSNRLRLSPRRPTAAAFVRGSFIQHPATRKTKPIAGPFVSDDEQGLVRTQRGNRCGY